MGYIVQSIVFDKDKGWDMKSAREWVKNHKEFSKPIKEEETINTIRVRLFPPKKAEQMGFTDYRMKTLASGDVGIMLDIAYNKMKGGNNTDGAIEYEEDDPVLELRQINFRIARNYRRMNDRLEQLQDLRREFPEIESDDRIQVDNEIRNLEETLQQAIEQINLNNAEIQRLERTLRRTGGGTGSSKVAVTDEDEETESDRQKNQAYDENKILYEEFFKLGEILVKIQKKLEKRMALKKRVLLNEEIKSINARLEEIEDKMAKNQIILIGGMNGFSIIDDTGFHRRQDRDVPFSEAEEIERDYNLPRLRDITGEKNPLLAEPVEYNLPEDMRRIIHQYEGLPTAVSISPNSNRAFERFDPRYFFDTLNDYLMGNNDERSRNSALPYLADDAQMIIALRNAISRENRIRRGRRRRGEDDEIDNITLDFDDDVSNPLNNRGKPLTPAQERDADEYETLLQIPFDEMTPDTQRRFRTLENKVFGRNRTFLQRLFGSGVGGSLSSEDLEGLLAKSYKSKNPEDYKDFKVDKDLSGQRVQVYHNPTTQQTIVAHRGTASVPNWIENVAYAVGNDKSGKAFQHSKKIQDQAYTKYGKENITTIGHSKGALHAQEYGKEGKEIITLNKPVNITDALFTRVPKSQTDIRTQYDPVSFLRPFQRGNKAETIKSTTKNPLKEHQTSVLGRLDPRRLFGSGEEGGKRDPNQRDKRDNSGMVSNQELEAEEQQRLEEEREQLEERIDIVNMIISQEFNSIVQLFRSQNDDRFSLQDGLLPQFSLRDQIRTANSNNIGVRLRQSILEQVTADTDVSNPQQIARNFRRVFTDMLENGLIENGAVRNTDTNFAPIGEGSGMMRGGVIQNVNFNGNNIPLDMSSGNNFVNSFLSWYLNSDEDRADRYMDVMNRNDIIIQTDNANFTLPEYLADIQGNEFQELIDVFEVGNNNVQSVTAIINSGNQNEIRGLINGMMDIVNETIQEGEEKIQDITDDLLSNPDMNVVSDEEDGAGMCGGVVPLPHFDVNIERLFREAKRRWAKSPKMFENLEYERRLFDDKYGKLMRHLNLVTGMGGMDLFLFSGLMNYSKWVKGLEVPEISRGAGKKTKKAKK